MGSVSSITQSRQKYKKDLKEWKKMVERQLAQKNKAIHDLREVVRVQIQKNRNAREANQGLLLAIQNIEKQLKSKSNEDGQAEIFENCEKRMRALESRLSVFTSYLRETNKRVEQINTSVEVTRNQEEESSDKIDCLRFEFKELNDKMTNVADNIKRLEYIVLQIENRVNQDMTAGKQALLRTLLQEIYELEDEKDNLLKFAEDALGFGEQDRRGQLDAILNSTCTG